MTVLPSLVPSPEKLEALYALLSDLTESQFTTAVRRIVLTHKEIYPNTNLVAVLREYALCDLSEPTSAEAWGEIEKEKNRAFIYGKAEIKNPLAKKVVEILGWRNLCLSENIEADRAHFMKMYEQMATRDRLNRIIGGD